MQASDWLKKKIMHHSRWRPKVSDNRIPQYRSMGAAILNPPFCLFTSRDRKHVVFFLSNQKPAFWSRDVNKQNGRVQNSNNFRFKMTSSGISLGIPLENDVIRDSLGDTLLKSRLRFDLVSVWVPFDNEAKI